MPTLSDITEATIVAYDQSAGPLLNLGAAYLTGSDIADAIDAFERDYVIANWSREAVTIDAFDGPLTSGREVFANIVRRDGREVVGFVRLKIHAMRGDTMARAA